MIIAVVGDVKDWLVDKYAVVFCWIEVVAVAVKPATDVLTNVSTFVEVVSKSGISVVEVIKPLVADAVAITIVAGDVTISDELIVLNDSEPLFLLVLCSDGSMVLEICKLVLGSLFELDAFVADVLESKAADE